jgi:zinc transport system substrate-binding protein
MPKPLICIAALLLFGCSRDSKQSVSSLGTASEPTKRIVAVSYPLQYLTQRIAGSGVEVEFPAAGFQRPAHWQPGAEQISRIQSADLVVTNGPGADYAAWLAQVTLDESKICATCEDLELVDFIPVEDYQIIHSHGPEGEHSHPYFVPYAWLDPSIAQKQAQAIHDRLVTIYPETADQFRNNLVALTSELANLTDELKSLSEKNGAGLTVVTANPQLKFLTRAAGWIDRHLLWFDMKQTDAVSLEREFDRRLDGLQVKKILVTEPIDGLVKELLNRKGIETVCINLLDRAPEQGDYMSEMQDSIDKLKMFVEQMQ